MRKLMEGVTLAENLMDSTGADLGPRAKKNKQEHDALVNDFAELILHNRELQKHIKNSRLPRFVEKLTGYKGDITPSMLVTISKILDDYFTGEIYKKPHKKKYG